MAKQSSSGCAFVVGLAIIAGLVAAAGSAMGLSTSGTIWLLVVAPVVLFVVAKVLIASRGDRAAARPWERVTETDGIRITSTPGDLGSKDHFMTKIVGVTFRRSSVKRARVGDSLVLQREPENPHDVNAVCVILERTGEQIGYLSRNRAEYLARQMSSGALYAAQIEQVTGGWLKERGLNIRIWRSGWNMSLLEPPKSPDPPTPRKRPRTRRSDK